MAALGIDWVRLLWQMINFLILLWILQRLLFKPILRLMDNRSAKIKDSIEEAERIRAQAQQTSQANQAALEDARRQASEIVAAATKASNQLTEQARARDKEETERLLERARAEIELEKDRAIAEVRRQVVDLAILAAGKVIDQQLTGPEHYRLVNDFLQQAQTAPTNGNN